MTKYDYLNNDKTILSSDGKKPLIKRPKGFDAKILMGIGKAGKLKGKACEDYLKIAQQEMATPNKIKNAKNEGG